MRNKIAKALGMLSEKMKVPEPMEPQPLQKSFITLSADASLPGEIKDRLFGGYIDQLRQFIVSIETPFVLSISGSWGRGKTFLVERTLSNESVQLDCAVVRIDAWEAPDNEPAMPHILAQIAEQLGVDAGVKKTLITAGTAVSWLGVASAKTSAWGIGILAMSSLLKKTVSTISDRSKNIKELREQFSRIVSTHLEKKKKAKLIVFIDNLDRCSPEQCIGFLDELAKFLKTKKCLFILALDEDIVDGAIHQRYGSNTTITAGNYLEKIIDLTISLPSPQTAGLIELLGDRFEEITSSPDLRADMRNALRQFEMTHSLMTSEIAKNPRKMLRILKRIGTYLHFDGIARLDKISIILPGILFMSIIKAYKPKLFDALLKNPQFGTELMLLQNVNKRLKINDLDIGAIESRGMQERKDVIAFQFQDHDFLDDPECYALMHALADDYSRRRELYKRSGGPDFVQAIQSLTAIVKAMRV